MTPATWPRPDPLEELLLIIDSTANAVRDAFVRDLPENLRAGDLLVLNDAATLPASLRAVAPSGRTMEIRLAGEREDGCWRVVLFGDGDWRTPTERRAEPERLRRGDRLTFASGAGHDLSARVELVSAVSPRLVDIRFDRSGASLWQAMYRLGRPVQYSYLEDSLALWHVQTRYAGRPWAVELPSAGRPLTGALLQRLSARGVRLGRLTHAAGLSSTGDAVLDAALPLPERYDIPHETVRLIEEVRSGGGRVIAVGTTVVRALESCAREHGGSLAPGRSITALVLGPGYRPLVVDGLFTGLHEPTASHFNLIKMFAAADLLRSAYSHAESIGYRHHEFGDSCLILP